MRYINLRFTYLLLLTYIMKLFTAEWSSLVLSLGLVAKCVAKALSCRLRLWPR